MGRVLTNNVQVQMAKEATLGVLPGSPVWKILEPNSIKKYGADIKTVSRNPISPLRQRRQSTVTDVTSDVDLDLDLTMHHFVNVVEGFTYSLFKGFTPYAPSAAVNGSPSSFTVASAGALAANTILYSRGFTNAANNGLFIVGSSSTSTAIKVTAALVSETPPSNATVEVAGYAGTAGDLKITAVGAASANLTSTTLDFTTLGLYVGQTIWIGGDNSVNSFFNTVNRGYARITAIATHQLTLDKTSATFVTDDGTSTGNGGTGLSIYIYTGRFTRNVAGNSADYLEQSYQFELWYPNLQQPGPGDMYEYALGNYANQLGFDLPMTNKAALTIAYVGTNTPAPTSTRATNASSPLAIVRSQAFNTSSNVARLRALSSDETGLTTDFKSLKITLNNNVTPEKVVALLGAKYLNVGTLDVNIEAELIFTNPLVINDLINNATVSMDFAIRNNDGAIAVEIPSMTFVTGVRDFPMNQSVMLKTTGQAFVDPALQTSLGITVFPYVPVA